MWNLVNITIHSPLVESLTMIIIWSQQEPSGTARQPFEPTNWWSISVVTNTTMHTVGKEIRIGQLHYWVTFSGDRYVCNEKLPWAIQIGILAWRWHDDHCQSSGLSTWIGADCVHLVEHTGVSAHMRKMVHSLISEQMDAIMSLARLLDYAVPGRNLQNEFNLLHSS